jgi:site-specific recombinase XerD
MSETAVNRLLRAALAAASVQRAETFSSHSLRVGGATAALAVGVDPVSIKALGRWDSSAYKAYTRLSQQAARRLGVAVASAVVDF